MCTYSDLILPRMKVSREGGEDAIYYTSEKKQQLQSPKRKTPLTINACAWILTSVVCLSLSFPTADRTRRSLDKRWHQNSHTLFGLLSEIGHAQAGVSIIRLGDNCELKLFQRGWVRAISLPRRGWLGCGEDASPFLPQRALLIQLTCLALVDIFFDITNHHDNQ